MEDKGYFFHALKVNKELCIGCSHCMQSCPTEAIRIREGYASISENICVDCGECYRVCPANAIYVQQDDFQKINQYKNRIALVPAVFIGQFPNEIKTREIYSALIDLGFTHVYEVEQTVDFLRDQINETFKNPENEYPLISSYCPAAVRLIQVKYPALTSHIIHLKTPVDLAALDIKSQLTDQGIDEKDFGIFYITPCAAKIAAIKNPVGEASSAVTGALNMNAMYNRVYKKLKENKTETCSLSEKSKLSDTGVLWSLTAGEADHITGRALAIDGMENLIEFLEKIENEEIKGIDFLELRACDQSCAGGILSAGNRFLSVERLKNRAKVYQNRVQSDPKSYGQLYNEEYIKENMKLDEVLPRPTALDKDMGKALQKMQKVQRLMCYLPGFDCGACGAPNCESLATDIAQSEATLSHCPFMQRVMEKNYKLSPDHSFRIIEKVWGKDRLNKDCSKKGAVNEDI
ncbi:MAG: 4Fe-4S binding protein [Bacteroidales bacterium]|nr:4Fe-4S binding protein [Bacteroidales bacterium]